MMMLTAKYWRIQISFYSLQCFAKESISIYLQINDAIFLPQKVCFSGIRWVNVKDVTTDVMHLENKSTQNKNRIQKKRRAITSIIDEGM